MGRKPFPPGGSGDEADHGAGVEKHEQALMQHEQVQGQLVRGFVHDHARWLRALAARFVGSSHADDVAHNAFLSLVTWVRTSPPHDALCLLQDSAQLKLFMYRLTVCRAYDHLRREQRQKDQLTDDGAPRASGTETAIARPDPGDIARVERAYAGLSPLQRIAHMLHHYYELDHAKIAAILGISIESCRTVIYRANHALKCAMEVEP